MLCQYAECHYAECHVLFIGILNVITLNVVMLGVVARQDRHPNDKPIFKRNSSNVLKSEGADQNYFKIT